MENKAISNIDAYYYNVEKNWLVALIPNGANVILDIGCANGRLGSKLRLLGKASEIIGVEIFDSAAKEAAKSYDKVYSGDIEKLNLPYSDYFDFIICGDILEHLYDPLTILNYIHGWLKNDGALIACVPNVRYWRIIFDLIFFGKWEYVDAGILDSTHLRFFTRKTAINLLKEANFTNLYWEMIIFGRKKSCFNKFTLGIFEEFLGSQVILTARK